MSTVTADGWRRSSPFSIAFFIANTTARIANHVYTLVGMTVLTAQILRLLEESRFRFLVIPAVVLSVMLVGALRYWCFRFRIEEDRLRVRQGVLKKTSLDLPFDRVQGINVSRSATGRILGLVTVSLDSAGSEETEGTLPWVSPEIAELLRVRVERAQAGDRSRDQESLNAASSEVSDQEAAATVELQLTMGDMVRIGLSSSTVPILGVAVGMGFMYPEAPVLGWIRSQLEAIVSPYLTRSEPIVLLIAGLAVAGLVLLAGISVGVAVLRYHGFVLFREGGGYRSRSGLLTEQKVMAKSAKIQQVRWTQNFVLRFLNRLGLTAYPARDSTSVASEVLAVPLVTGRQAQTLCTGILGSEGVGLALLPDSQRFKRVATRYIRAVTLRISAVFAVFLVVVPAFFNIALLERDLAAGISTWGVWFLACVAASGLFAWFRWLGLAYHHDAHGMVIRRGFVGRRVDAFLFRKAQSVTVGQSPLQRRHGLATLTVQLASEKLSVPYVSHDIACRVRDYVLFKAESSQVRWH